MKIKIAILAVISFVGGSFWYSNLCYAKTVQPSSAFDAGRGHEVNFCGLPSQIHPKVPAGSGFCTFGICVPKVISRSGQPSMIDFQWLKDNGWKSVVDLRLTSDARWQGFNELHLNYLALPIIDNSVPSEQQAQKFLAFVTDPVNLPVHIHCLAGEGRTGVMIALYRYSVQDWPMDKAIDESHLFGSGINKFQENWLKNWARAHKPEYLAFKKGTTKFE